MKANDFKSMGSDELQKKEQDLTQELFNLKFQLHTGRLENSAKLSSIRKDIARVKTILREKRG
ncbi:50S ribosomal protein L29 [Geobacter sp. DSM 9736]|uniref:50S ribosomal protein L29 n=1 Tax=Geobacter sp. DSM 9736 TaxID=1277350 RepID=UPI000B510A07|nr:50S ribosomal protein L29 [Geobacter sp. DSM 9736]SNB46466.1 LSU ribosomal protein L29P [Geobacter sp. DSM 9736]